MLLNLFWKVPPTGWKLFLRFPNISKTYHVYVITLFKEPYCFSNITIHSITRCVRHSSRINVIKRFTLCPKRLKYNPEKTKGPKGVLSREFLFRAFVHQHKNTNKHLKNKCVFQCFSRVPTFRVQVGVLTWRAQIRDRVRVTSFNSESPLKKCIITKNRNLHMTNFYTAFYTMLWCVMLFFSEEVLVRIFYPYNGHDMWCANRKECARSAPKFCMKTLSDKKIPMDADYAPGHLQFPNKIYLLIRRRVFCRVIRERFEFSWIYVFLWIPLFRIVAMLCSPVNIPMNMNNLPKPLTDEQYEYFQILLIINTAVRWWWEWAKRRKLLILYLGKILVVSERLVIEID